MKKHDDNAYSRCGMNGHWVCACRIPKHFMASIKGNGNKFETQSTENAYEKANIEVNNALIKDIPIASINDIPYAPMEVKSLEDSDFFEDPDDKAKSLSWWKRIQT